MRIPTRKYLIAAALGAGVIGSLAVTLIVPSASLPETR